MTADGEEVVVDAESRQVQHRLHRAEDLAFERRARSRVSAGAEVSIRSGGGNARRSILPLGNNGISGSGTRCCGTM